MITFSELVTGEIYFLVSFYDQHLTMPNIRSMIYVGEKSENESVESERRWYFQDVNIFLEQNKQVKDMSYKDMFVASKDTLNHIYDLVGLIDLLEKVRLEILAKAGI